MLHELSGWFNDTMLQLKALLCKVVESCIFNSEQRVVSYIDARKL